MEYVWDDEKNRSNIKKHGVAFEDAVKIFGGAVVEQQDDRFEYGEIRIYAIGLLQGLELVVVYADDNNGDRRIISARKAEKHERKLYWEKQKI